MANAIEFLNKLFSDQLQLLNQDPTIHEDTVIGAYIVYLFGLIKHPTWDFGFLSSRKKAWLVWTFKDPLFRLGSKDCKIDYLVDLHKTSSKCEDCRFYHILKIGATKTRNVKKKEEFDKLLKSLTKKKDPCNKCDDGIKRFILEYPLCLGFDGCTKIDEPIGESPDEVFNRFVLSSLKTKFGRFMRIGGLSVRPPNEPTLGDYDILGHVKKNGRQCVFSIENKFVKSIGNKEYIQFVDRHHWLSKKFESANQDAEIVSVFFDPYTNTEERFHENLRRAVRSHPDDRYNRTAFLEESLKERSIICLFGEIPYQLGEIEKYFVNGYWSTCIKAHIEQLHSAVSQRL